MDMTKTSIKLLAATNVGLVRKNNEDNFVVNKDLTQSEWLIPSADETVSLGEYGSLLVVADGMGGANAGEVASAIAIETVQEMFTADNLSTVVLSPKSIDDYLVTAIKKADMNICNHAAEDTATQGMGTTIVICWIIGNEAHVAWCGDSRCYVFRNDSFMRVTKDHSYVQSLVDEGKISEEEAFDHPYSNVITRCLGSEERAKPDVRTLTINDGDIYLLCTDGLCGLCRDDEIMDIVIDNKDDLYSCRDLLIQAALEAGGYDNVTIAIGKVDIQETEELQESQNTEDQELEINSDETNSDETEDNEKENTEEETEVMDTVPNENLNTTQPITSSNTIRNIIIIIAILAIIGIIGFLNEYPEILGQLKSFINSK